MQNSHSRHQDILPDVLHRSLSCLWVINFAVGLHRALNLQEDCSCGSAEPWATVGPFRRLSAASARHALPPALGMFPVGSCFTAPSKACSRQGWPLNRCFLIYLYSQGSPVLINYHLHSILKGKICLGECWRGLHLEIQSRSSGCMACCWQQHFLLG